MTWSPSLNNAVSLIIIITMNNHQQCISCSCHYQHRTTSPLPYNNNTYAKLSGFHLRPHGRVIYDPTVGSSTTPRSGHLRPHGRVMYDPTVGSSTTPRSGIHSFIISKFIPILPFVNNRITVCSCCAQLSATL